MNLGMSMVQSGFVEAWQDVLHSAIELNASDIHIEPFPDRLRVRMRVDGTLRVFCEIADKERRTFFFDRAFRGCNFEYGKRGRIQDRRFSVPSLGFDFRASLIPNLDGDRIVLRLLKQNRKFDLATSGIPLAGLTALKSAMTKGQGLIIVTGPTGSGKTTFLYSALAELVRTKECVLSVEDPVEYRLDGVSQAEVSEHFSFSEALKGFMRQDPDAILVGEIRDVETARAAVHAANTGHLVFSTLHTNSARETLSRMADLGIDRTVLETNVSFVSAQRLVPKLCPHCRTKDAEIETRLLVQAVFGSSDIEPLAALGCDRCEETGILGRVLLFEFIAESKNERGERVLKQFGSLKDSAMEALKEGNISAQDACAFEFC